MAGETNAQGVEDRPAAPTTSTTVKAEDPSTAQREPAAQNDGEKTSPAAGSPIDRKLSTDEWDASKTPPSRFQQPKGSVYATPKSRDAHVDQNTERDRDFHETVATMKSGLFGGKRRKSSSKSTDGEYKDGEAELQK